MAKVFALVTVLHVNERLCLLQTQAFCWATGGSAFPLALVKMAAKLH
jgi:hypothetical protein